MPGWVLLLFPALLLMAMPAAADKLTFEERVEIMRGLTAEYATAKIALPRAKNALPVNRDGTIDQDEWAEAAREHGPAVRSGDLCQVTKVEIESKEIKLEINGGFKGGRKWYERIEVGVGSRTTPIANPDGSPVVGTSLVIEFPDGVPPLEAAEFKKMLAPILDFEKRSVTELYVESLPAPIQEAIKEKRAVEGMDKEQVLIAMGRPRNKVRETKDGMEQEEWIYGLPPGKITFVVFNGDKVVQVKEMYAGLGGSTAPRLDPR